MVLSMCTPYTIAVGGVNEIEEEEAEGRKKGKEWRRDYIGDES